MTGRYSVWDGDEYVDVDVPISGGEDVMIPVIRAIVVSDRDDALILLQRRADPSERVEGLIEIPGGRWNAGEHPADAAIREVLEETGISVSSVDGVEVDELDGNRTIATIRPFRVIAGVDGAFPAVHVIVTARGSGTPRDEGGETSDVRWWTIDDLRTALRQDRDAFVPYAHAALSAYTDVDAGS